MRSAVLLPSRGAVRERALRSLSAVLGGQWRASRDIGRPDHRAGRPAILPTDAVDIREVHDTDANRTWGCFRTPGGADAVRSKLHSLQATRVSGRVAPGNSAHTFVVA